MTIDQDRAEKALHYLAVTDGNYAYAKMDVEETEILRKRVRQRIFLTTDGTVAERNATADVHEDAVKADTDYINAVSRYEELKAKRQRAEMTIELFRTLESSRRKGMV